MSKNTLYNVDEIVSKAKIVSRETAENTGRNFWQPGRPGETHQNWETHTGKVDLIVFRRSCLFTTDS